LSVRNLLLDIVDVLYRGLFGYSNGLGMSVEVRREATVQAVFVDSLGGFASNETKS